MNTTPNRLPATGRSRTPLILAVAFAAVLALALVAVIATRDEDGGTGGTAAAGVQNRTVEVTGAALPPLPDDPSAPDPAVGQLAPELRGASFDGTRVNVLRNGTAKIVIFVAHWCPHCQKEIPLVTRYLAENPTPAGVEVYAVSTGVKKEAPNYPPSAWLARENWPAPVLADSADQNAASAWGLSAYPYFVSLDKDGKVLARRTGELPVDEVHALFLEAAATVG